MDKKDWQNKGKGHRQRLREKFIEGGLDRFSDEEVLEVALEDGQRLMAGIRGDLEQVAPPIVVPLPHKGGIARESLGRGQILGAEILPISPRAAERRHSALGADPRAGDDKDFAGAAKSLRDMGDDVLGHEMCPARIGPQIEVGITVFTKATFPLMLNR